MSSVISIEDLSNLAIQSRIYYNLETLCICFPARISGSDALESALDHLFKYGKDNNLNSYEEIVNNVPNWIRGDNEYCSVEIIPNSESLPIPNPLFRRIRIMANGMSVGTNEEGITSEVIIIHSWEDLDLYGNQGLVKDKIVLFDYKHFYDYPTHSQFRNIGAEKASKMGAKGVLIRTIAPDETMSGAHTGTQSPIEDGVIPIPAACVAIEDVELMRRLMDRGHKLNATIKLPCIRKEDRKSRNLIFEIIGCEFPDEIVIVGGHTDSWDCSFLNCQGAHDDGQGVIISLEIIKLLSDCGLKPKRTIRAVLFVDEEVRQTGARAYCDAHKHESDKIVAAIETDLGAGTVVGFGFSGTDEARILLREILSPLNILGDVANINSNWSGKGVDISPLVEECNVPGLLLRHSDTWWYNDYFHMHHSESDTIDHVDPNLLLLNYQVLLGAVWLLANSDQKLPR